MKDCIVNQCTVENGGFEVITRIKCDSYPRRQEATAVVDCSVDQFGVVECGLTGAWNIPRDG